MFEAIGQGMDLSCIPESFKKELKTDARRQIQVDACYQTSLAFFPDGDFIEGPDVIHAIATVTRRQNVKTIFCGVNNDTFNRTQYS
ncbi:MAG: hypothetical protein XD77_0669 [Marinimicrobia bacterium 46_47]|nr:MAG: hypothetical protein XD77_0669 [Marinimicrobia bacterium 46_47]KUK93412.1 MAG: hypothetical protein XE04_0240 [Marinimicrobia bacterium 46_43]HBY17806.1 hypothetical protein [Candidatus Neomarinimicrobiota bacterium]